MKRFIKDPDACIRPGNPVILDLVYGWGNSGWSALDEYLVSCIQHAQTVSGPILECGSGLSTLLVGAIANMRGQPHWALEHTPEWGRKVQKYLTRYQLNSVVLCQQPLKDYGGFCWYDVPLEAMPDSFSLVICDGPPGDTKGGRYGLVPVMKERLKPGCVLLLDDAVREQELSIARHWAAELGANSEQLGYSKPYIRMAVMDK